MNSWLHGSNKLLQRTSSLSPGVAAAILRNQSHHNWYCVYNILNAIFILQKCMNAMPSVPPLFAVVHGLLWCCAAQINNIKEGFKAVQFNPIKIKRRKILQHEKHFE